MRGCPLRRGGYLHADPVRPYCCRAILPLAAVPLLLPSAVGLVLAGRIWRRRGRGNPGRRLGRSVPIAPGSRSRRSWPHLAGWRWLPGGERGHVGVIAAGVQPGRSGQVADGQHQAAQQPGGYDGRLAVAVVRGRRQALTRRSSTPAWMRSARRGCAGPRILPRRGDLGNALIGRSRPYRWHAVAEPVPGAPMAGQADWACGVQRPSGQ